MWAQVPRRSRTEAGLDAPGTGHALAGPTRRFPSRCTPDTLPHLLHAKQPDDTLPKDRAEMKRRERQLGNVLLVTHISEFLGLCDKLP